MTTLTLPAAGRRAELRAGARAMAPLAIGYLPFALLVGAAVAGSADPVAAWAATPAVYGGSVHLTILQMLRDGSGLAITVAVGALMNARLLVYSTALAPDWAGAPVRTRLLVAASVIDPSWLIADRRAAGPGGIGERRAHYTGAAVTLAAAWTTGVTAGALLGAAGPALTELAAALPLCLVALVAPHVRLPGGGLAVLAAGLTAVLARGLPPGLGLLLCMAAAAAAGLAATAGRSPC